MASNNFLDSEKEHLGQFAFQNGPDVEAERRAAMKKVDDTKRELTPNPNEASELAKALNQINSLLLSERKPAGMWADRAEELLRKAAALLDRRATDGKPPAHLVEFTATGCRHLVEECPTCNPRSAAPPETDEQLISRLMRFYSTDDVPNLLKTMESHIEKLQQKVGRPSLGGEFNQSGRLNKIREG